MNILSGTPLLVRGGAKHFKAVQSWNNTQYLHTKFGEQIVSVKTANQVDGTHLDNVIKEVKLSTFLDSYSSHGWRMEHAFAGDSVFLEDIQLPFMLQCEELVKGLKSVLWKMGDFQDTEEVKFASDDILAIPVFGSVQVSVYESFGGGSNHIGADDNLDQFGSGRDTTKKSMVVRAGDILYIPKYSWYRLKIERGSLMHLNIHFDLFPLPNAAVLPRNKLQMMYQSHLQAQPNEIQCANSKIKVTHHLNIDFNDVESVLNLRIPKRNERPADVILASGYKMPVLGFGTALLNETTYDSVMYALKVGYRMIDTAYGYPDSEVQIGQAVRDSGIPREKIFIVSKLHPKFHGFEEALQGIDESLKRLQMDYVDAYLIHSIDCDDFLLTCQDGEPKGTWRESWRAMEHAHAVGKIRSLGVSNFGLKLMGALLNHTRLPVSLLQNWFDPLHQDVDARRLCAKHGVRYMGYSTLGSQWVYLGMEKNPVLESETILSIAGHYDYVPSHVVLRWAIHVNVTVIPRSSNRNHIEQNFRSLDISMHPSEIRAMNQLADWMEEMLDMVDDMDEQVDSAQAGTGEENQPAAGDSSLNEEIGDQSSETDDSANTHDEF